MNRRGNHIVQVLQGINRPHTPKYPFIRSFPPVYSSVAAPALPRSVYGTVRICLKFTNRRSDDTGELNHDCICKNRINGYFVISLLIINVFLWLLSPPLVRAQISYGGSPAVPAHKSMNEIPVIRMPGFNVSEYLRKTEAADTRSLKPMIFAKPFELAVEPSQDGVWTVLPNGTGLWRVALESEGALSLNIIFSSFRLEPGVSVFVYNPDQSDIIGAFDNRNNSPSGTLALSPVRGDRLIIEMQVENGTGSYGELVIGRLNHDYTGIHDLKISRTGRSDPCNLDINCPTGDQWQTHKNAVVRIMTHGNQFCTGVLVNNTANDGTPYLMTANHCIPGNEAAGNSIFFFGFERPSCNSNDSPPIQTLSGAELLATDSSLDFTLLELDDLPPRDYNPWYTGWNLSVSAPEKPVSIHHPLADFKKISSAYDPPSTSTFGGYIPNGHWLIRQWDLGTTEPGSSGSPLFDRDGYLVGLLTGGTASCGSARNDFYSKFNLAWDRYSDKSRQLKHWLDSLNTGTEILPGFNPYANNEMEADFTISTTEICLGDNVVFTDFSSGDIESWQWDFGEGATPSGSNTQGPHLVKYAGSGTRTASLTVGNDTLNNTQEVEFNLNVISENLPVADFSYEENLLSIQFIDMSQNAENYYWEFSDTRISTQSNPLITYHSEGEYLISQLIRNRACSDTMIRSVLVTPVQDIEQPSREIRVYPVPAADLITIDTGDPSPLETTIELYSAGGQRLMIKEVPAGQTVITIDLSAYPGGTYILKIQSGYDHVNFKLPVLR